LDDVEQVLAERLALIRKVQQRFKFMMGECPRRFRRGDIQRVLCEEVAIPCTGLSKRLVNEALAGLGFVKITVDGIRYFRKKDDGRRHTRRHL
jgi:hypothetical protein